MTNNPSPNAVSRRDFARHIAVAAGAFAIPEAALAQNPPAISATASAPDVPKEIAAEVETKFNAIMKLSAPGAAGTFTVEQKDEIRRQLVSQVQGLQKLRSFALDNGNAPALVLRISTASVAASAAGEQK